MPVDHPSSVSHTSVVRICSPALNVTRSSHSDKSVKAATELPSVGFSSSVLGNPWLLKSPHAGTSGQFCHGSTGLSMELCGVSLHPSRHAGLAAGCHDRLENSVHEASASVKHCLDLEESDSCIRSPKISRKCNPVDDEPNICDSSADTCAKSNKSSASVETDCDKGRLHNNDVIRTSMSSSVSELQRSPGDLTTVTPVTQRSRNFLVCLNTSLCLLDVD